MNLDKNKLIITFILFTTFFYNSSLAQYYRRPGASSYVINNYSAETMFNYNFSEKYKIKRNNMWVINRIDEIYTTDTIKRNFLNQKTKTFIFGIDFVNTDYFSNIRYGISPFVGIGNAWGKVEEIKTGKYKDGKEPLFSKQYIDGYSGGINVFTEILKNKDEKIYINAWTLYGYFPSSVRIIGGTLVKYKKDLILTGIESGITFNIFRKNLFFTPNFKFNYSYLASNDFREPAGTLVSFKEKDNFSTTLAAKIHTNDIPLSDDFNLEFNSYLELNLILNSNKPSVYLLNEKYNAIYNSNIKNIKLGSSLLYENYLYFYGNFDYAFDKTVTRNIYTRIGFNYLF